MNLNAEISTTEFAVGELLAKGDQTKEIAHKLYKSPHTIIQHRKHLFEKAGVTSIGQFCYWWFHRYYDIKPKVLITTIAFFFLALFNEVAVDNTDMVRTARSSKVRRSKRND